MEIAAGVETPSCDEDCCMLVALGSEHADGKGVVDKDSSASSGQDASLRHLLRTWPTKFE